MLKQNVAPTLPLASRVAPLTCAAPNLASAARHPSSVYGRTLLTLIIRLVHPNMVVVVV